MAIITLTSDLGLKDNYVASVKATILSQCPNVSIVDITHQITKFDLLQTAFVIKNVFSDFPDKTIHIIGVMPERTIEKQHVAVFCRNQYFIGADNGMFPLFLGNDELKIVEIEISSYRSFSFPMKDIFAKAACHLAEGGKFEDLGKSKEKLNSIMGFNPVVTQDTLRGKVIYIDDFGNVMVNITEELFHQSGMHRKFEIIFRSGGYRINKLSRNYSDVPEGEMLAMFGATGFLEIAINAGNASELLGIQLNDIIMVDFGEIIPAPVRDKKKEDRRKNQANN